MEIPIWAVFKSPVGWWLVPGLYYPIYTGDYNNPRTGNPELTQPVFHGMTQGFLWPLLTCLARFGHTGVAFETRLASYASPNRTLALGALRMGVDDEEMMSAEICCCGSDMPIYFQLIFLEVEVGLKLEDVRSHYASEMVGKLFVTPSVTWCAEASPVALGFQEVKASDDDFANPQQLHWADKTHGKIEASTLWFQ